MINSCNDTKGIIMAIRYNKLWKKLIDENMMKVDLRDQAGITTMPFSFSSLTALFLKLL